MVVAASIRNQRSDDGLALLKRDSAPGTAIGTAWTSQRSPAEKLFPDTDIATTRAFIVERIQLQYQRVEPRYLARLREIVL